MKIHHNERYIGLSKKTDASVTKLAEMYGVSISTVSKVRQHLRRGETFTRRNEIPEENPIN